MEKHKKWKRSKNKTWPTVRISSVIFYHLHKTGTEVVLTIWKITRNCFELNEIILPKTSCVYFIKIKFRSEFLGRKCLLLFVPSWLSNSHSCSVHGPRLYAAYMLFCFLGLMLEWANHIKPLVGNPTNLQRKRTKWENNMPDLQTGWLPKKHLSLFLLMFIEKKGHMDGQKDS